MSELTTTSIWLLYADGTACPNPGRMGLGALLVAPDGTRHEISEPAGRSGCNNEAEILAVMAGLHAALALGAQAIRLHSDNSILIGQLQAPRATVARLEALFNRARELLSHFEQAEAHWLPRHRNAAADTLSRAALKLPPKPARKVRQR